MIEKIDEKAKAIEEHARKYRMLEFVQNLALTAFISTVLVVSFTIIGAYVLEKPKMYYKNLPFPVYPKTVKPGEPVPALVERCNISNQLVTYKITRILMSVDGGESVILPPIDVILEPGCKNSKSMVSVIPMGTKPGMYRLVGNAELDGTLRKFSMDWYTETFEVVEK